jgi:hypothetical protein
LVPKKPRKNIQQHINTKIINGRKKNSNRFRESRGGSGGVPLDTG